MVIGAETMAYANGYKRKLEPLKFFVTRKNGESSVATYKNPEWKDIRYLWEASDDVNFAKKHGITCIEVQNSKGIWFKATFEF